jgi:transcriptional regulator with XRE-family HTH domain
VFHIVFCSHKIIVSPCFSFVKYISKKIFVIAKLDNYKREIYNVYCVKYIYRTLKELIGNNSISKTENKSGVSVSTLSLYLSGKRKTFIDNIIKLSQYFSISLEYLLGLTYEPNAKGKVSMDYQELKEVAEKYKKIM